MTLAKGERFDDYVFFTGLAYNKNVIMIHNNPNKSVKECIYGAIDFE